MKQEAEFIVVSGRVGVGGWGTGRVRESNLQQGGVGVGACEALSCPDVVQPLEQVHAFAAGCELEVLTPGAPLYALGSPLCVRHLQCIRAKSM